jgi:hypothetical protein
MAQSIDEIANAIMNYLYTFVGKAAGDIDAASTDDPFCCWCKPGIPFVADDFKFAKYLTKGQGTTEEERVADADLQLTQLAGFSRFVDFVPSVNGIHEGKIEGGVLRPGSAALSTIYKRILESSITAQLPEPQGINELIEKLREQAKPMQATYREYKAAYGVAKEEYVMARLKASYSPADAMIFRAKGAALKGKVVQALQDWEIDGFKTQYENLQAEIQSLRSKRSPAIWRDEALKDYNSLPDGQDALFGEARMTFPYPGSFADSASGWLELSVSLNQVDELNRSKSTKYGVDGRFGWGSFKLGGSVSGSTTESLKVTNTNNFGLTMAVAQVSLLRNNWFDPWFLKSEFWRFKPDTIEGQRNTILSDGGLPPKGELICYPVSAIFVRNVVITLNELHDETSDLVKTFNSEARGGWGLGALNLGGSYERNSQETRHEAKHANGKLSVPGLQLVGFMCEMMGKSPNPKEGLTWVGGA